jgi:type III secretion protein J
MGRTGTAWVGVALFALLALLSACTVPIAAGLEETDANRVVVALDRAAIEATKEADPAVEGRFRVMVTRDDAARALGAMRNEELPRPHTPGVLDSLDKGALVPSAAQEHAQLVSGMAGDLARTLEGVDGVLSARVHLNVAAPDPLRLGPPPKTTASVLLEARLIAGGVPDLALQDVAVVFVPRPAPPLGTDAELRHVGPIAVAQSSMRLLQVAMATLLCVVSALAAATLVLYGRLRRLRQETVGEPPLAVTDRGAVRR